MGGGLQRRPGEPARRRSGAVLIVDDDASVRKAIVHMLGLGGFPALEAASGREGIDALGRDPGIALVLLDLYMNPMDGRTFRQLQLADPKLAAVPTVVLTGAPLADVDDATLMADDYLLKPVGREHLLSVVSAYCIAGR